METVTSSSNLPMELNFACDKPTADNSYDCFEHQQQHQQLQLQQQEDGCDEATTDVAESFEMLHQSIPWLQKASVSSDSHKGQLKILQAAIDYIIDLEEQLTEHLSEDLYLVAIRESKAALERTLTAGRRPFADINADDVDIGDRGNEGDSTENSAMGQPPTIMHMQMMQASFLRSASHLRGEAEELHRSS